MQETIDDGIYAAAEPSAETKSSGNDFRSEQLNFLQSKLELVRNRFVYKTLAYDSIVEIAISDGHLIKNRWIIRILGVVVIYLIVRFLSYGLSASGGFAQWNLAQWFNKGSLIGIWGPVFIILLACLALFQSFIRATVFKIKTTNDSYDFRIKTFAAGKTINQLKVFLQEKELFILDNRKTKVKKD